MGNSPFIAEQSKRWLRKARATAYPANLLFFDTETVADPELSSSECDHHKLRLGHAIAIRYERGESSRRKTADFVTQSEWWEFLESRLHQRLPLWVFAHNLSFDMSIVGFWELLGSGVYGFSREEIDFDPPLDPETDKRKFRGLFIDSDPPTVISVHHKSGAKINFVDSLNYWRMPLSALGESLGFAKLETPDFAEPDDVWFPYCRRDVEILERAITGLMDWHRRHELGSWGFTQASMSMNAYRFKFMRSGIELHSDTAVKELERESYYGGRLEMFFQGKVRERVYMLDINSMYPALMRDRDYPCELLTASNWSGSGKLKPDQLSCAHIAEVLLESDADTFPLRNAIGTVYPTGRYWTTLAGPELERAIVAGVIQQVGRWALYRLRKLFGEYVDFFYTLRLAAKQAQNPVEDMFCKIFMNSLYGKFGQKTPRWESWDEHGPVDPDNQPVTDFRKVSSVEWLEAALAGKTWDCLDADTGESTVLRKVGRHWQVQVEREEHPNAFPAIASYVTAYGRELVNFLRSLAGPDNVYYVVTDALFVNGRGLDNLRNAGWVNPKELGKLGIKAEGDTSVFDAIHHYEVGDVHKFGSRKSKAVDLGEGWVRETHFEGLASIIKRPANSRVKIYPVEKHFRKEYKRGIIKPNGWIEPIRVDHADCD